MSKSSLQATFGLRGDFPGDDALEARIKACQAAYNGNGLPPLTDLIELINDLPKQGRLAIAEMLAKTRFCDEVLRQLFDYCFEPIDNSETHADNLVVDEDFVWLSVTEEARASKDQLPRMLNTRRYHIFPVVTTLLTRATPTVGAAIGRDYLKTASTRHLSLIFKALISNTAISNEELLAMYQTMPTDLQKEMVQSCATAKTSVSRVAVLDALMEQGLVDSPDKWKYYASGDCLKRLMAQPSGSTMHFKRWAAHGDVYLNDLKDKLDCYRAGNAVDRLKVGEVWKQWVNRVDVSDVQTEHVDQLLALVRSYEPCQLHPSTPANVRTHIEQLSAAGHNILAFQDYVQRIELRPEILRCIPKRLRKERLLDAVGRRDWDTFCQWNSVIYLHPLIPARRIFEASTAEDLWKYLLEEPGDRFFRHFADLLRNSLDNELAVSLAAVEAWHDLHKRATPDRVSPNLGERISKKHSGKFAWSLWFQSYMVTDDFVKDKQARAIAASKTVRPLNRSRLTLYSRCVHVLLDAIATGSRLARNNISVDEVFAPISSAVEDIYGKLAINTPPEKVVALNKCVEELVYDEVISFLESSLQFDPSQQNSYIAPKDLEAFGKWMGWVARNGQTVRVMERCYNAAADTIRRASKDERHVPPPNHLKYFVEVKDETGKQSFVFFDSLLHQQAIRKSAECLKLIVENEKSPRGLRVRAWSIVLSHKKAVGINDTLQFVRYCCTALPQGLRDQETEHLVEMSCQALSSIFANQSGRGAESYLDVLSRAGLVEYVADSTLISDERREWMLQRFGGFEHERVRTLLRARTQGRDGHERASGHSEWLRRAGLTFKASLLKEALEYTTSRLKNEAGLYRSLVYATVRGQVGAMIKATMKNDDLASARAMVHSLVQMLQNDLERRDSVGQSPFHSIATTIMGQTLEYDPTDLLLEVREEWIKCAVRLSWEVSKASGGDKALLGFSFPLNSGSFFPVSRWVRQDKFDRLYPQGECPEVLGTLRARIDLRTCVKDFRMESVFGPSTAVGIFAGALESVWDKRLPCPALFHDPAFMFPVEENASHGVLARLKQLYHLCGIYWESSPLLARIFDGVFNEKLLQASESQFHCACRLLELLLDISAPTRLKESSFYEHPRLARAVDVVFRYAVSNRLFGWAQRWIETWRKLKLYQGASNWNQIDREILPFLVRYGGGCEPPGISSAFTLTKAMLSERRCSLARMLLSMTSSAIYLDVVRTALVELRQDVLTEILCGYDDQHPWDGVFLGNDISKHKKVLFSMVTSSQLEDFSARLAQRFCIYALSRSRDDSLSVYERTTAAENFMTCPWTHYIDVLDALSSENLDAPLFEALALRIFSIDSPWHVLAYLLSADQLEGNRQQRTTASLLASVAKHVHVDVVVETLGLLLSPVRRAILGITLHKSIVRMLFSAGTEQARHLLQTEWTSDLHQDVRHVIIMLCLQSVIEKDSSVDWEWSVLTELASRTDTDFLTSLLMLAPLADRSFIDSLHPIPITTPAPEPSVTELHSRFTTCVFSKQGSPKRRERFRVWAHQLSKNLHQPGLRRVAMYTKWSLSPFYFDSDVSGDNDGTLRELQECFLDISSNFDDIEKFWISNVACLYGRGLACCLDKSLAKRPEWRQNRVTKETRFDECSKHLVARQVSSAVGQILEELWGQDIVRNRQLWEVLSNIHSSAAQWLPYLECFEPDVMARLLEMQDCAQLAFNVTKGLWSAKRNL